MYRFTVAISFLLLAVGTQGLSRSCLPKCTGTQVACFVDPCQVSTPCEAQANLTCVSDYCDGCHARYYDNDCNEVECSVSSSSPQDCVPECTGTTVNCFVDPCMFSTPCEAQAGLECVADYCDGCHARYYDDNCNEVTCPSPQDCLPECQGTTVNCFVDPCVVAQPCAAQAGLECVSDYCDGCHARYYDDNCNEVTCPTSPQDCLPECQGTTVNCFVDPCVVAQPCAAQAGLECVSDYCDGCHARFYDDNCNEVTCSATSLLSN